MANSIEITEEVYESLISQYYNEYIDNEIVFQYDNDKFLYDSENTIVDDGFKLIKINYFNENKNKKIILKKTFKGKGLGKGGPKAYIDFEIIIF